MAGHVPASLFVEVDHDDRWLQPGDDPGDSFATFDVPDEDDADQIRFKPTLSTPEKAKALPAPAFSTPEPGGGVSRNDAREQIPRSSHTAASGQFSAGGAAKGPASIPVQSVRLPGQLESPKQSSEPRFGFSGIHKNIDDAVKPKSTEQTLIRPKFGSFIPIEAFDNVDYEKEIETVLQEFTASGHYDPQARKRRMQEEQAAEFLPTEEDKDDDEEAKFAAPQAAKRIQQNKTLAEAEKRLEEVVEKAGALSGERDEEEERNRSLRAEVRELKKAYIEIEDVVSDLKREGESKGALQAANASEARKFKELELRMKREEAKRRAIELGLEYEDDESAIDPELDKFGLMKAFKMFQKRAKAWFHEIDPTYKAARKAQSRFGGGVALYFWFFRWIIFVSMAASVVWIAYYIWHFIDFSAGVYSLTLVNLLPVNLSYASFRDATSYAACVVGCIAIIVFSSVYKFVHEYKAKHDMEIQDANREPSRYAKLMFTAWDWAIKSKGAARDQNESIIQSFTVLKREDETALRIRQRSQKDWNRLYIKRSIGLSLNSIVILAGWGGIIFSKVYLADLIEEDTSTTGMLLAQLPTMVPSLINLAMPAVTDMCVDLEEWDDPTFILKMRVGRLYAAKILNALIQVAIVLIFFRGPEPAYGINRITLRDCAYYSCEDQAARTFFIAFVLDVAVSSSAALGSAIQQYYVFTYVFRKPKLARTEFLPQRQVIKIFYQQIFVWLCLPHFPFCAIVAPVLWYLQFAIDAYVLFRYNAKPVRPFDAKDTGVYFAVFYTITLFLFLAWFYYIFFFVSNDELDPNCCRLSYLISIGNSTDDTCLATKTTVVDGVEVANGAALCLETAVSANGFTADNAPSPLFSSLSMAGTLDQSMNDAGGFPQALALLANSALLAWFLALLGVLWLLYSRMRVKVLVEYLEDKIVELTQKQDSLALQIRNKERRIEMIAKDKVH